MSILRSLIEAEFGSDEMKPEMKSFDQEESAGAAGPKEEETDLEKAFKDDSGFDDEEEYGEDKIDLPDAEGLAAAVSAANDFSDASDGGEDTEVDLAIDAAFKDNSGFEEADEELIGAEHINQVDPATVPADNKEVDQFEDLDKDSGTFKDEDHPIDTTPDDKGVIGSTEQINDDKKAYDDQEEKEVEESYTGWDDLF